MASTIPILPRGAGLHKFDAPHVPAPPPLALYVHFPWCVRKCPYCDFNSHGVKETGIPERAYLDTVVADIETALPQIWGRPIVSVFIGGGTPSLLSPAGLDRLLGSIRALLPLLPGAEITLEANPGTIEAGRFAAFKDAGVTRVSVGVQSLNDAHLQDLGRIHDRSEALHAIELAARTFDTWNVDLMYALPRQSMEEARADLETVLDFAPPHVSCYQLTLEPNTLFHRNRPPLPDADLAADMQEMIEGRLADTGYQHYETSAFARPGYLCRHNLNYWTFGDYLGVGPGAHGKLSDHQGIRREMRHKHPQTYLDEGARGSFVQDRHAVGARELPFEFMMNALRLLGGVPVQLFRERTGLALEAIEDRLLAARQRGLLDASGTHLRPTERGRLFLNDLLELFLPH